MGVPGLASRLEPFSLPNRLQCKDPRCRNYVHPAKRRHQYIVDGPSLAYHVYAKLCSHNRASTRNPLAAQPSYEDVGRAMVLYLDTFQLYGEIISSIYFDGFLPSLKRPTRIQRLEAHVRQLGSFHATHAHLEQLPCPRNPLATNSVTSEKLFTPSPPSHISASLPPLPFLVPSVVETLSNHPTYGSLTMLVPDEAEVYCAASARDLSVVAGAECLLLTSDSDLVLHRLGTNSHVAFLRDVDQCICDACGGIVLRLMTVKPDEIMSRLKIRGWDEWIKVGYEVSKDRYMTLADAARRVRKEDTKNDADFMQFKRQYDANQNEMALGDVHKEALRLRVDVRLAEFMLQVPRDLTWSPDPHVYLPVLHDNPTRVPAWSVSTSLRTLAYSLAHIFIPSRETHVVPKVLEYSRSGSRITSSLISLFSREECASCAEALFEQIEDLSLTGLNQASRWQAVAVDLIIRWCISEDCDLPKFKTMARMLREAPSKQKNSWTWEEVRIRSMIEAAMYGLRMVMMVLSCIDLPNHHAVQITQPLKDLQDMLGGFPTLVQVLEPNEDAKNVITAVLLPKMKLLLDKGIDINSEDLVESIPEWATDKIREEKKKKAHKKEKRARQKMKEESTNDDAKGDWNSYAVLECFQ